MRTAMFLAAITFSLGLTMMLSTKSDAGAAADKPAVLRHVVLYKFKLDVSPAQVQQVVDAFAALPGKIDGIVGFEHGTNVSPEGKSDGLTHAFVVSFADEKVARRVPAPPGPRRVCEGGARSPGKSRGVRLLGHEVSSVGSRAGRTTLFSTLLWQPRVTRIEGGVMTRHASCPGGRYPGGHC